MTAVRIHYMDTSAIVKLLVEEDGSKRIRDYFSNETNFHTTSLCFVEALGVLKRKREKRNNPLSNDEYLRACEELCIFAYGKIPVDEISIVDPQAFRETQEIAKKHALDLIDCFQIYTLRKGMRSHFVGGSQPILITADKRLAEAAESQGLKSWDILNEERPLIEDGPEDIAEWFKWIPGQIPPHLRHNQ